MESVSPLCLRHEKQDASCQASWCEVRDEIRLLARLSFPEVWPYLDMGESLRQKQNLRRKKREKVKRTEKNRMMKLLRKITLLLTSENEKNLTKSLRFLSLVFRFLSFIFSWSSTDYMLSLPSFTLSFEVEQEEVGSSGARRPSTTRHSFFRLLLTIQPC